MATPNTKVVKTKDYEVAIDNVAAKILASDKYTGIYADTTTGLGAVTSANITNGNLLISFTNGKTVTVEGYSSNNKVKSALKYINLFDGTNVNQYLLSDFVKDTTGIAPVSIKGASLQGTLFGDNIDLSGVTAPSKAKTTKGYTINAGAGDDVITGSKYDDTIIGGKGDNTINVDVTTANAMGNDVVTLTKGENLTLLLGVADMTTNQGYVDYAWTKNGKVDEAGKDLTLTFYNQDTTLGHIAANVTGTLTIKNYKSSAAANSIILKDTNGNIVNLYDHDFAKTLAATDKSFAGTWVDDNVTSGVTGKATINLGEGNNTLLGGTGNETVKAGKGNDTVTASNGDDVYTLGAGANSITYAGTETGTDTINLTKGETLSLTLGGVNSANVHTGAGGVLEIIKNDLQITVGTKKLLIKNYISADKTGTGAVKVITSDGKTINLDTSYNETDLSAVNIYQISSNDKSIKGTWLADVITSTATSGKVSITAGEGDNTITTGGANDTVKAGKGDDTYNASNGDDNITLGAGNNTYTGAIGKTGTDTITLTKAETLSINLSTINDANIDMYYEKNDLVIASKVAVPEFKTIVIKNFKTNANLGAKVNITTTVNTYDLRDNAAITKFGMAEVIKANFTGTDNAEVITVDGTFAPKTGTKGLTINTKGGNDVITGSKYNDTITGGAGENVIKLSTSAKFGDDTVVLTKGEKLVLQLDTNTTPANYVEYGLEGKNLVVKVYNSADHTVPANYMGSVTIKNYASKDVMNNATKSAADSSTLELKSLDGTTLNVDLKEYLFNVAVEKATVTGGWLNENIDASGYTPVNHKGVTVNAGAGNDVITGSAGDDKITGGLGNNTFIYKAGNGGEDTITLTKGEQLTIQYVDTTDGKVANVVGTETGVQAVFDKVFTVTKKGNDVILTGKIAGLTGDVITIKNANNLNLADLIKVELRNNANNAYIQTAAPATDVKVDFINKVLDPSVDYSMANTGVAKKDGSVTITGSNLDETLIGTLKADTIKAVNGTNIIDGLGGGDTITGGKGVDTIVVGDKYGETVVNSASADDILKFKAGSTVSAAGNISFRKSGNDLQVQYANSDSGNSVVTLKNWYTSTDRLDKIKTNDDTSLSISELMATATTNLDGKGKITGTEGNDNITGSDKADTILGLGGNDTITPGEGKDTITGGAGTNTIVLEAGDGEKVINLTAGETLNISYTDTDVTKAALKGSFIPSVSGNDVIFERYDLTDPSKPVATGDKLTIKNLATTKVGGVNVTLTGSDGPDNINLLTQEYIRFGSVKGTSLYENIIGTEKADTITTGAGVDTVTAIGGNDTITVDGAGTKTINIAKDDGNDTIKFTDAAGFGATTIKFTENTAVKSVELVNGKDLVITSVTDDAKVDKVTTIVDYATYHDKIAGIVNSSDVSVIPASIVVRPNGTVLKGSNLDETFVGDVSKADTITTGAGTDTITSLGGDDIINVNGAGTKNISIVKEDGTDTINITDYNAETVITFDTNSASELTGTPVVSKAANGKDLVITRGYSDSTTEETIIKNFFTDTKIDASKITLKWNGENAGAGRTLEYIIDTVQKGIAITGIAHKNNTLAGTDRNDLITGKDLVDTITTGAGDDTINAGTGDDKITVNGAGTKTINIGKDDENDTISFTKDAQDNKTTIKFTGNDVTEAHTAEIVKGKDLVVTTITTEGTKETTISDYVANSAKIAGIVDNDGDSLLPSKFTVRANGTNFVGSDFNETFTGVDAEGKEAETFTTGAGADDITAGKGNDTIKVNGFGDKLITIGRNDGNDVIELSGKALKSNVDTSKGETQGTTRIVLATGTDGISYAVSGTDLIITSNTGVTPEGATAELTKTTTIKNYFSSKGVEEGKVDVYVGSYDPLNPSTGKQTITYNILPKGTTFTGTDKDDVFTGIESNNETFITKIGDDVITPNAGNDKITVDGAGVKTINLSELSGESNVITLTGDGLSNSTTLKFVYTGSPVSGYPKYHASNSGKDLVIEYVEGTVDNYTTAKATVSNYFTLDSSKRPVINNNLSAVDFTSTDVFVDPTGTTYTGTWGKDTFTGTAKADTVTTGAGNDTIDLGLGNDVINVTGVGEKDIAITTADKKVDTINMKLDADSVASSTLDVDFKEGQTYVYTKDGSNLVVSAKGSETNQTVKVVDYFKYDTDGNGTKLAGLSVDTTDVKSGLTSTPILTLDKSSAKANQTINGSAYGETILGGAKVDTITTGKGTDVITADEGNDVIKIDGDGNKTVNIGRYDGDDTIELTADAIKTGKLTLNLGTLNTDYSSPVYEASLDGKDLIIKVTRPSIAADPSAKPPVVAEDSFTQTITIKGYFETTNHALDNNKVMLGGFDVYDGDGSTTGIAHAGVTVNLVGDDKTQTGEVYQGTAYVDTVNGSKYDDVIKTGNAADNINPNDGDDAIILTGTGAKTINIAAGGGDDTISVDLPDGTASLGAASTIVVGKKGAESATFKYAKDGDDLVIGRQYSGDVDVDGTTTLVDYFKSADSYYKQMNLSDGTTAETLMKKLGDNGIQIAGVLSEDKKSLEYVGTAYVDTIEGSDEVKDVVSGLGAGADKLYLGEGENVINFATTGESGEKKVFIDAEDGDSVTTLNFDETTMTTATVDLKVTDKNNSRTPEYTYEKDGRNLIVTVTFPKKTGAGDVVIAEEVVQTVNLNNYFDDDKVTLNTNVKINGDVIGTGANTLTSANFDVSDAVYNESTKKYELLGTANGETLTGTEGDDVITANAGADKVIATKGKDTVTFGAGAKDVVLGRFTEDDSLNVTVNGSTTTNFDFGTFNDETDTMSFVRKGDSLIVTTDYAKLGNIEAGISNLTIDDYFKSGVEGKSAYKYVDADKTLQTGAFKDLIGDSDSAIDYALNYTEVPENTSLDATHTYNFDINVAKGVDMSAAKALTKADIEAIDDTYTITTAAADAEASNQGKIKITDNNGDEIYTVKGAGDVTLVDKAGMDDYTIDGSGNVTITDAEDSAVTVDANDTYTVKSSFTGTAIINESTTVGVGGSADDEYSINGGKVTITDAAGDDEYTVKSTADVTINDTLGDNTLIVSDKASTEIAVKLLFTSDNVGTDTSYNASLVIGNTVIDKIFTVASTDSRDVVVEDVTTKHLAVDKIQTFGLVDKADVSYAKDDLNALIQNVTSWTADGGSKSFGELFNGDKTAFETAEVVLINTGDWTNPTP